jgi:hypothetical protein
VSALTGEYVCTGPKYTIMYCVEEWLDNMHENNLRSYHFGSKDGETSRGQAYMEEALGGSRNRHLPAVCFTRRSHRYCTKYLLPACLLALVIAFGCTSPTFPTTLCAIIMFHCLLHRNYPSPTLDHPL